MKFDRFLRKAVTVSAILAGLAFTAQADDLQGQHSDGLGNPQGVWTSGNLQNWKEMEYIPCRVVVTGGPVSNKLVTVEFPNSAGGTPGIQNLTSFVPSANVVMTSVPTLDSATENWKYTFTVKITNNQPGTIEFFARMRAGAHLFTGSSLKLSSPPLQIHKPDAGAGIPDLTVTKTGPTSAGPGDLITYTIYYTNKISAANMATGVQLTDVLPSSVTYVPGSASNGGEAVGNNLVWDLPDLAIGASGVVTYQAVVNSNVVSGSSFQNSAEILSSEDDFNYGDNTSIVTTLVAFNRAPVANPDSYTVSEDSVLNVSASGILANDTDLDGNPLTALLAAGPTRGTLSLNSNGSFNYSPNANFHGIDSFTYRVNDGTTNSGIATVTITVSPVNDAPVASDDSYAVAEGGTLNPNAANGVLVNDTDAENNALTSVLVSNPAHGTLTLNADGSLTYIHDGSETTSDVFTYKANDGSLDSEIATVNITVTSENDAPVANNDSYTVAEGGTLIRTVANGVLANDSDAETNLLSAILVSNPAHGILTLNPDGSLTYVHDGGETTSDSFTYKANDGLLDSGVATVNITITSQNDAPVANDDSYTVAEGGALNRTAANGVLINDSDAETNSISAILVSNPAHGTLTLNADGSLTYVHDGGETTNDAFTYKANDGSLDSGIATVNITITPKNDAPVANDDSYTVAEGGTLVRIASNGVLVNDTDAESNALTSVLISNPAHGTVTLNADGSLTYIHDGSETTSDVFTYKANDGSLDSGIATVNITVMSENDAPVANNDSYSVAEGGTLNPNAASGVLANDTDAETNSLTAILISGPANGTLTLSADGSFNYVHNGSETTSDSFTYKVNDGFLDSGIATVTITITSVNDAPVANNDSYNVAEGGTLTRGAVEGILANDTDAETNSLTAILVSNPSHGTLTLNPNGSLTYIHDGTETTSDSFTYKANDGLLDSGVATVNIAITSQNDAPIANDDSYVVAEGETLNRTAANGVLVNDSDAEMNALNAILISNPTHGSLTLNPDGSLTYVHDGSETASDTFTYKANDGSLDSGIATVTITITSVNDAPVAKNDFYSVAEGGTLDRNAALGVLSNDTDAETNLLTSVVVAGPTNGILTLNTNGSFTYIHNGSETKTDSFTYKANDGLLDSGIATVTITITELNDAPVANDDFYDINEGGTLSRSAALGIMANDTDAETNSLTAILVSAPTKGALTLNTNTGSFTYVHNGSEGTNDSFTYRAFDGLTNSGIATVTIRIVPVNDAPVAKNDAYSVAEGETLATTVVEGVLTNDTDAETNSLTAILVSGPVNGTLTFLNTNGSFSYVHNGSETKSDSFTYKANDGLADSGVATVNITITSVNDAPVANNDLYEVAEGGTLARTSVQGVLANDTDAETNSLHTILISNPAHGTLVALNADGAFTYIHDGSETTNDSFTYKANDGLLDSGIATVNITITSVNDAPIANGDSYEINEDQILAVTAPGILANDNDAEINLLSAVMINAPTNGTLVIQPDGSFTYSPNANFNGVDSFTYVANDGVSNSPVTTVGILVSPVNDAPSFTSGNGQLVNQNTGPRSIANWATAIQAGPANEQNQTVTFQLSNNNTALFSQQPAISPDGTLSFTPASNAYGIAIVSVVLKDNGGTANGGIDTAPTQTFAITVNGPPIVNLISPTNGSAFIWGQDMTLVADAFDADGSVTNVEFFAGTNNLGGVPVAPYFLTLTNMQPGIYQFTATATDNFGLSTTSSVITITVLGSLPFTEAGPMVLNRQTGLLEQRIRVENPTPLTLSAARVLVFNIPTGVRVYNANGTNNGVPFVQYNHPISPGGFAEMLIEYLVPSRIPPATTLVMEIVPISPEAETMAGTPQKIDRAIRFTAGTFLIEFNSAAGRYYSIQYSSDLVNWKASSSVQGTGSKLQWIDNGAPKTESLPANSAMRFYRVILLP